MADLTTLGSRYRRREGDVRLRAAYADHAEELFGLAFRALRDRDRAEQVVQETFVRAWRAEDRFDASRAAVRTWLLVIARNLIVAARGEHVLMLEVEQALAQLSEEHRHAVVEIHYRRRPLAEVAAELDVPLAALRRRMFYGLKALRLALEEMGWSCDG